MKVLGRRGLAKEENIQLKVSERRGRGKGREEENLGQYDTMINIINITDYSNAESSSIVTGLHGEFFVCLEYEL